MSYLFVGMRSIIKIKCLSDFIASKNQYQSTQIKPVPSKLCYYSWKTSLNQKP